MNCCNPVNVYNQSRYINASHYPRMVSQFPCGHCENCLNVLRTEWQIRAYYEAKRCLEHGGYLYFDCLTYSEPNIPKISFHVPSGLVCEFDNYAFCRRHVRLFRSRLRRRLEYLGYPVSNDNIRIFVGSEYASDSRYTQRSHYHLLFYVNLPITPVTFSTLIDECWHYGRTDGVTYKGVGYVLSHNTIGSMDEHAVKASNYVSKYVLKEIGITNEITRKVRSLFDKYIYPNDPAWLSQYPKRQAYKRILRECLPFHVQSQHYGEYAIELYRDKMLETMMIPCATDQGLIDYALPSYYRKKLFYSESWINGIRRFIPNSYYFNFKLKNLKNQLKQDALSFQDLVDNGKRLGFLIDIPSDIDYERLSMYQRVYRGRLNVDSIDVDPSLIYNQELYDIKSCIGLGLPVLYGYQTYRDLIELGGRFYSDSYLGDKYYRAKNRKYRLVSNEEIRNQCYFDEKYEKILEALATIKSYLDAVKARDRYDRRLQREYYKTIGLV